MFSLLIKVVLEKGFLLFIMGIFWNDISKYIQLAIAKCNPKIFEFVLASIVYTIICIL